MNSLFFKLMLGSILFITGVSLIIFISVTIPPNMDEFIHYRPLSSSPHFFPNARAFSFGKVDCSFLDIDLFGIELPLRAYNYIGFTSSIFYLPIYLLFKTYYSARLMAIFSLALFAWLVHKITRVKLYIAWTLAFFCMPLIWQTTIDTGPVAFQLIITLFIPFILYIFLRKSLLRDYNEHHKIVNYGLIIVGLLSLLGIQHKIVFIFILPGIFLFSFIFLMGTYPQATLSYFRNNLKTIIKITLSFSLILVLYYSLPVKIDKPFLISVSKPSGETYNFSINKIPWFLELRGLSQGTISPLAFREQISHFKKSFSKLFYLENFGDKIYATVTSDETSPYYFFDSYAYWLIICTIIIFASFLGFRQRRRKYFRWHLLIMIGAFLTFIFTIWCINLSKRSELGHHIILAWPFLILAIASGIKVIQSRYWKTAIFLLLTLSLIQIIPIIKLIKKDPPSKNDWSRVAIFKTLKHSELAQKYIYVVIDWGYYYLQALYGNKSQIVIAMNPLTNYEQIEALQIFAKKQNRKLAFILQYNSKSNIQLLRDKISGLHRLNIINSPETAKWLVLAE